MGDAFVFTIDELVTPVFVVDASMRVVATNRAARELLGLAEGEFEGNVVPPPGWIVEDEAGVPLMRPETGLRAAQTKATVRDALISLRRVGASESVWVRLDVVPRLDASGAVTHVFYVMTDVTRRRRAELALQESDARYRALFDSLDAAVLLMRGAVCIDCNPATLRMFGLQRREEILGKTPLDFAPEVQPNGQRSAEMVQENVVKALALGMYVFEWESRRANGERFFMEVRFTPYGPANELFQCIAIDISERKQLEAERAKAQKLDALGTLAGGIAHDFNNLLQGVFGNIAAARAALPDATEAAALLDDSEQALERAVQLTNQLLTFARGGKPLKKRLDLGPLLEAAARFALSGSSAGVAFDVAPDLPPVEGDEAQVARVVQNVVLNAAQAMPRGGVVRVRARAVTAPAPETPQLAPGRWVSLAVQDTGVGIPAAALPRIFDPYFSTKAGGSGLGLATVYSIVKNHGGFVDVRSEVDAGTTVFVYLPAAPELPARSAPASIPAPARRVRVLVMDDEPMIRSVSTKLLTALGHAPDAVEDGAIAVERYARAKERGEPYDFVILDLTVPGGVGGLEALARLRAIDPDVRAVVSSGYSDDAAVAEYRAHGFRAVLRKPYTLHMLRDTIADVLR